MCSSLEGRIIIKHTQCMCFVDLDEALDRVPRKVLE